MMIRDYIYAEQVYIYTVYHVQNCCSYLYKKNKVWHFYQGLKRIMYKIGSEAVGGWFPSGEEVSTV
jgi:hypothetical protein